MKRIKSLAVLALSIALFTANAGRTFAVNSTSITLSGASAQVGNNLTVFVNESSGSTTINLVTTNLSYDSSKLQFVEFNDSGSEFDYKGAQSAGGGSVSVKRGLQGGAYTGSHRVVGLTFKALAAGSASVSVTSATVTNPQAPTDVEWNGQKDSTAVSVSAAPVVTPSPTQPVTAPKNSPTKKSTTTTPSPTTATTSTTPATSDTTRSEVKGDETKKSDDKKSTAKKDDTKKDSNKSSVWGTLALLVAAVVAFMAGRRFVAGREAVRRAAEEKASAKSVAKDAPKKAAKTTKKK